jgi:hypothetical protein
MSPDPLPGGAQQRLVSGIAAEAGQLQHQQIRHPPFAPPQRLERSRGVAGREPNQRGVG